MTLTLPKTQERVVNRLVRSGKFRDSQAVLREALRRLARDPDDYLNPPPLTKVQVMEAFGPNPVEEERENRMALVASRAISRMARKQPPE